ncbi:hypothetical protein HMPREF9072_00785 [Capnocytophaga sp. oral taxon 324 str. F0483]|nr:hypothetical protein HMPREF9072_00785 [Capnocytophaga sp. oral taxon 324 str. F0483]
MYTSTLVNCFYVLFFNTFTATLHLIFFLNSSHTQTPSPLLSTFFCLTSYISSTFFHQNSISQNASSQKSAIYRPTFVQGSFKVRPSYLYNSKFFFLKILIPISLKNYLCGSLSRVSPRAPNQTLLHFFIFSFSHFQIF